VRGALLISAAMFIFSSIGPFVRTVALPVAVIICITSGLSALFLLAWFVVRGKLDALDIRGYRRWLLLSAACIFGNVFCYYHAYRMTTMANAVITHYTAPVFAALLAPFMLGEKWERVTGIALLISLAGMVLLAGDVSLGRAHMAGTALGTILLVSAAGPKDGGIVLDWVRRLRFGADLPGADASAARFLALPIAWLGLAAGGAIHLWRRRHTTTLADLALILAMTGTAGAVAGVSWSARAERLLYHAQALSIPLAGVGMWLSLSAVRRAGVRSWMFRWAVLGLALLALGALLPATGTGRPRYWRYFEPGLHERLDQVLQETPVDARILALPSDAIVLQALGRVAYPTAPRFNDPHAGDLPWVLRFFSPRQDSLQRAVLLETRTDFVFSRVPLALRGLDLVHPSDASRTPPYLYRVDRTALSEPLAPGRQP